MSLYKCKTISESIEKIIGRRRLVHRAGFKRNYDLTQDVKNPVLCRLVRESKNDDISQILQDAESKISQILQDAESKIYEIEDDKLKTFLENASIKEWAEFLQENYCHNVDDIYSYIPMELFSSEADEDKWFKRWRKAV
ncbi:uncharacterized protein METZ01_LOCUS349677, partial [marine metagenome]